MEEIVRFDTFHHDQQEKFSVRTQHVPAGRLVIKPVRFYGLVISCLLEQADCLTPLEAFHMTYFSQVPEDKLIRVLQTKIHQSLRTLTRSEEEAFVCYFGLKVTTLRIHLAVSLSGVTGKMKAIIQSLSSASGEVGITPQNRDGLLSRQPPHVNGPPTDCFPQPTAKRFHYHNQTMTDNNIKRMKHS